MATPGLSRRNNVEQVFSNRALIPPGKPVARRANGASLYPRAHQRQRVHSDSRQSHLADRGPLSTHDLSDEPVWPGRRRILSKNVPKVDGAVKSRFRAAGANRRTANFGQYLPGANRVPWSKPGFIEQSDAFCLIGGPASGVAIFAVTLMNAGSTIAFAACRPCATWSSGCPRPQYPRCAAIARSEPMKPRDWVIIVHVYRRSYFGDKAPDGAISRGFIGTIFE